jgi:hypothetical protein
LRRGALAEGAAAALRPRSALASICDYMASERLDSKDPGTAGVRGVTVRLVSHMSTGYPVTA